MGEARIGPVGEFQGDDDAPIRVTSMAARSTESGGVACVAGCDDGRLFLVECSRDDTVTCVEMRRDSANGKAGTPGDGGASTPSKWGMAALSATKAALSFLREPTAAADAAVTVVKSVTWAPNASNGDAARVLVLTDTIVEEWEVDCDGGGGYGLVQTHRASAEIARALRTDASRFELVSASPAPGEGEGAVVILAALGGAKRLSIHRIERRRGNTSVTLVSSTTPAAGTVPASNRDGNATLHAGGVPSDAALVVTAAGGAALFAGDNLDEQLLMHDPAAGGGRVLASAAAPSTGGWLMLTELMGVVAYAPVPAGAGTAPVTTRGVASPVSSVHVTPTATSRANDSRPATMATDPIAVNVDPAAAEASVRAEFAAFANGTGGAPAESGFRLKAAGALAADGSAGCPFAATSRNLADALPKHWSGASGPGPATESHLDEKARRHDLFLRFLAEATGVWNLIPPVERERVLEHGELVAALLCVRSLHNEAAETAGEMDEDETDGALEILREAATTAGVALQENDAAVRDRPAAEVCYSRATGVCDALLPALADGFRKRASVAAGAKGASLRQRAEALDALSRALLGALGAAAEFRTHHAGLYPPPAGGATAPPPRWSAGANARSALREAATAAAALREESARGGAPELAAPLGARLLALATPLLDACAANLESAAPGTSARAVAREEYVNARHAVLPALLDAAKNEVNAPASHFAGVTADAVASVAEAHFGYEQLAEVCEAVAHEADCARDPGAVTAAASRLHHYMRTLRGAPADNEGSFATFVFERARKHPGHAGTIGRRVAQTLRNTPDEFYEELETCLAPHPSLLWVHQLRVEDYSGAARTALGLAHGGGASLAQRVRFLSLAKLSLLADGVPSAETEIVAIDAALDLTAIQTNLSTRRGSGSDADAPLPPLRLVEACLGDGAEGTAGTGRDDDVLDGFAVFASAGSAFRSANKSLLETLWRRAAAETDWEQLSEQRTTGGDAGYVRLLRATLVARATRRCYDETNAARLGAPFVDAISVEEVLELLENAIGGGDAAISLRDAVGIYATKNADSDEVMA